MKKTKKIIVFMLVGVLVLMSMVGCSNQQASEGEGTEAEAVWPEKNVNIIVGYGAGGSTDTFARILAKHLEPVIGQPIVVSNVPGGGGAVGYSQTLTSKADGYTVVVSNGSLLTLGGIGNVDFGYGNFDNIARVIAEDETVCVSKNSEFKTVSEMVEYAKANPGELKVGFAGVGGFTYLAANQFIASTGIDVEGVGYGSGSEAVAGLLGGFVDFIVQQPGEIYSQYKGGELKVLATMGDERHPLLTEIPTCKEEGFDLELYQWRGISAPKDVPDDVKDAWYKALNEVQQSEEFRAEITEVLLANTNYVEGQEFEGWLQSESDWIYPLIDTLGLKNQ